MKGCSDKKYSQLLSAYELGILTDDEVRELELHLFDCEHCFKEVLQFDEAVHHLNNNEKIKELISQLVEDNEAAALPSRPERKTTYGRKSWVAVIPVAAVVLLLLVLRLTEVGPFYSEESLLEENRLAVMCFDYTAESDMQINWGKMISNLLISDLAGSHYVQAIPNQRFSDVVRNMGVDDICLADQNTGLAAARTLDAKWMIVGNILEESPVFVVSSQVIDVFNNRAISAMKITSDAGEDIFSLVDRLTLEVKKQLSLPADALHEPDQSVAEITTRSVQAYNLYLNGVDNFYRYYLVEAKNDFENVIELDSSFAMAYYYLSFITDNDLIYQAEKYSRNTTEKDGYYILSRAAGLRGDGENANNLLKEIIRRYPDEKRAYFLLSQASFGEQDFSKTIEYINKAIEIDPLYKPAYNLLPYAYLKLKNYERAIWAINKYIELAPGEANPYDSRGDIYGEFGYPEKAIESYQIALSIKPDFIASLRKLGLLYLYNGQYEKADSCFRELTPENNPITYPLGLRLQADLLLRQGKFMEALKKLDVFLSFEQNPETEIIASRISRSLIYLEMREFDKALEELRQATDVSDKLYPAFEGVGYRHLLTQLLLEKQDLDKAEEIAQRLKRFAEEEDKGWIIYRYAQGYIELNKGNADNAVTYFSKAAEYKTEPTEDGYFETHFMLARAHHEAGQFDRAIEKYRSLLWTPIINRHIWTIWDVKINYYLGLAYETTNQYDAAAEQYKIFTCWYWDDADINIPEIIDARERLDRLAP